MIRIPSCPQSFRGLQNEPRSARPGGRGRSRASDGARERISPRPRREQNGEAPLQEFDFRDTRLTRPRINKNRTATGAAAGNHFKDSNVRLDGRIRGVGAHRRARHPGSAEGSLGPDRGNSEPAPD
jgi:hypothetical protein